MYSINICKLWEVNLLILPNSKDNNFIYIDNYVQRCNPHKLEFLINFILIIINYRILVQRKIKHNGSEKHFTYC